MRTALILVLAASCTAAPAGPPVTTAELRVIDGSDRLAALLVIDDIEAKADPAAGPWLLAVQRDTARPIELRTRAAAALAALGYAEGEAFCLAVLGARLVGFEAFDARHALPSIERWAFPRDLALRALQQRLRAHGVDAPAYDVNLGAADLRRQVLAYRAALEALPRPKPQRAARLETRVPKRGPAGWSAAAWHAARAACIEMAR